MTVTQDAPLSLAAGARLKRLRNLSTFMKWLTTLFIVSLLAGTLGHALALIHPPYDFLAPTNSILVEDFERSYSDIPLAQRLGILASMLGFLGILLALAWNMRALFLQFEAARFFEHKTLSRILAIGICLILCGVLDVVDDMATSVLATQDLPEAQRMFNISIDGGELFFMIFGGLFLVFGWVMREAATIDEENRQFI